MKMGLPSLIKIVILSAIAYLYCAEAAQIKFEKCGSKGFTCKNSTEFAKTIDIIFQCNTKLTGQNVTFEIWQMNAPNNMSSLTIQNCKRVRLCLKCTGHDRLIQTLNITNVQNLEIIPAGVAHSPPKFILQNITHLDKLPKQTFAQIKQQNRPHCIAELNEIREIFFLHVNIGTIETEAFWNLSNINNFSWIDVSVNRINFNAIDITFTDGVSAHLRGCNINIIEPMAFRIIAEGFYITHTRFSDIWGSGFNGSMSTFVFNNNSVTKMQSGAISVFVKNVYLINNHFSVVESGAFQKIAPGLLNDSKMNFANIRFVYVFSNNFMEGVINAGVEPDRTSYQKVATEITSLRNIMQMFMNTHADQHQQRTNIIWN